jgi:hypothetical protein
MHGMTLSITILNIGGLFVALSINYTQKKCTQLNNTLP